jgi:hypothetical protein
LRTELAAPERTWSLTDSVNDIYGGTRFGWDPPKNDRNVAERGLPFAVAMALFDGPTLEVDDTRRD